MYQNPLSWPVIVITGASSGFGKGAARRFAEEGASLVLAARRDDLIEELADECRRLGSRAIAVPTDVSRQSAMERLAESAVAAFGRIDVWVNDAGVGAVGRFDEIPLADHIQLIQTNLLGTLYGSYFALREFRRQQSGTLINIASALGKVPAPYYASYTASKFGVVGLSGAIRQELRESGNRTIHVCTILPMAMDTPFFEHASNYTGRRSVPIPPLYDPDQVIDAIVRLAHQPEDEVIVGGAGKVTAAMHAVAPRMTERYMGRQTHKAQIQDAPQGRMTPGAVQEPMLSGRDVRGGWQDNPRARHR